MKTDVKRIAKTTGFSEKEIQRVKDFITIKQKRISEQLKNTITVRRLMSFMIKLLNLKLNNDVIECDFLLEDSKEKGRLTFNIAEHKIQSCSFPLGYEWCKSHIQHAQKALIEMSSQPTTLLTEKIIMWC